METSWKLEDFCNLIFVQIYRFTFKIRHKSQFFFLTNSHKEFIVLRQWSWINFFNLQCNAFCAIKFYTILYKQTKFLNYCIWINSTINVFLRRWKLSRGGLKVGWLVFEWFFFHVFYGIFQSWQSTIFNFPPCAFSSSHQCNFATISRWTELK